jgi:hypothetical protein
LSWDDDIATTWTPVPGGRCPFEYFHVCDDPTTGDDLTTVGKLREVIAGLPDDAPVHIRFSDPAGNCDGEPGVSLEWFERSGGRAYVVVSLAYDEGDEYLDDEDPDFTVAMWRESDTEHTYYAWIEEQNDAAMERFPLSDWQHEVDNKYTELGYQQWLSRQLEQERHAATVERDRHDDSARCPHGLRFDECSECVEG